MKKKFLLLFFCLFFYSNYSQNLEKPNMSLRELKQNFDISELSDSLLGTFTIDKSTKIIKNLDAKISDYSIFDVYNDTIKVDTTLNIAKYYKHNYLRKDNFELIEFSNSGHTYNKLSYESNSSLNPNIGAQAKHYNYMDANDVDYYHVATPFTELMYRSAFVQGQLLDALFSVNTSPQFNFTIGRKGLRSLGNYQHFLSSSSNFIFSTNYNSVNNRYSLKTHYLSQNLFSEENGGIRDEDIDNFETGDSEFLDRSVFDPVFQNADNKLVGKRLYLNQSYSIKKLKDSLNEKSIKIGNIILSESKYYQFKQNSPNSFFGESSEFSSINDKTKLKSLLFNFYSQYNSDKFGTFEVSFNYLNLDYSYFNLVDSDSQFDYSSISDQSTSFKLKNIYRKKKYSIESEYESIFSGRFNGYSLIVKSLVKLNENNELKLSLYSLENSPNFNFLLNQSAYDDYNWENSFDNIKSSKLSFELDSKKIMKLKVDLSEISNYNYFKKNEQGVLQAYQESAQFSMLKVRLNKDFSLNKFIIDNQIQYQKVDPQNNNVINVPELILRNSIYYQNQFFDKALFLQTGFTMNYFSKFYMNSYDPLLSEFYVQNSKLIGSFPRIDFFINAKIQQTRIFLKAEHINSSMTGYNYYSAPNYPYRDFSVRFGLVWNFFM